MAELVAGAFLSSFLQVAFQKLDSRDFLNYFRHRRLDDGLLRKLHVILISVNKIVEDAEERQYRDHGVKQWLDQLKDEVFKAQDLLDDIATEASRQNLDTESQIAVVSKVRGFFNALVNQRKFDKEIESGIKEVLNNLENLIKQNEILGLREGLSAGIQMGVNRKLYKRLPTTCLIDESNVCGRDADKERIVEILLSQKMDGNHLPTDVIAITGMGGVGKTTLARLVYEDVRMKDQFQHRAWVHVSEEFHVHQVTKAILHSLNCPTEHDFHLCQLKLKETLMGKKFFLVLDDVWNENCKIWEVFQAPLKHLAPQSKILITTRNRTVAEVMCCTFTHSLKVLQDEDCWDLFAKHAFNNQHHAADPDLVQIGRKIINKCGGLPLAIKTLGSLLHRKLSVQYWDKILKSDIWQLSENDSNIIPSLRLSYHYLPSNLKRCFAYCSIFPKNYEIDKNVLIQLWMTDGLIHSTQKSMSLEEVGNEIFNDLESRSFFEPSRKGDGCFTMHDLLNHLESRSFFEPSRKGDGCFIMHDLLNDLAKSVTGEFFVQLEADQVQDMSTKTRYFSYIGKENANLDTYEKIFKCHRLRCFIISATHISDNFDMDGDLISRLSHLKYLRQLSLRAHKNFKNLTDGISNLKHLHYLDLSWTSVQKLPDSMCLLINLQTLRLSGCRCLTKLPSNFFKLINLRHLDLKQCGIQEMPKYMGKLNKLQTMNTFVVAKEGGSNLKELGALKQLKGSLTISQMECIDDPTDLREANLKEKQLDRLKLEYWRYNYSHEEAQHLKRVLEALEPNHSVKELTIFGYRGTKFPRWLGGSHFLPNLVCLFLGDCTNNVSLPALGQISSLRKLTIKGFDAIKEIGKEFYGNGSLIAPFPRLAYLMISEMSEWEEWDICYEGESFPNLEELYIHACPRLIKSLPIHLPSLKTLDILNCGTLKATLPKSSSMEKLSLNRCERISVKDMPTWTFLDVLPPLHDLFLSSCPTMKLLPQGGMLSNVQHLLIDECPKLIASGRDWGLHELLALKELEIKGNFEEMECFPEEGLLPPNLQSLSFSSCTNMKGINHKGLVCLQSLTSLSFYVCPRMSFEGMPEDCLPPSLSHLTIYYGCPLLAERCEKEKGPDWPKIAHIPHVYM